jgi:hypothetical protein
MSQGDGTGEKRMSAMTKLPEVRSDCKRGRFPTAIRFRAANGAMVSVTVNLPVAADETGAALQIAREAIAQLAAAQSDETGARAERAVEPNDCGASFWSWATPEGWRRPGT